ncbi:MAG: trypsin-like peptidase domain-containing protein [Betaproteobacteria bacterium AqS2]|uniref:Probable periplasmic serine endoprotease DegP-like n=1 Tax=Candidatus Amphirhobacter heronislandensis TaxID=1732024 RepID=A0A930XXF1_9GAMM|nr:trypsin-like peptidase domain-containing protein [Betaproteobacteria bacterium AqS2]
MKISTSQRLLAAVLLLALCALPTAAHGPSDYADLFEEASKSVVSVNSVTVLDGSQQQFPFFFGVPENNNGLESPFRSSGFGSGVIITPDGYILTNAHVIFDDQENQVVDSIEVILHDKRKVAAEVIGYDRYSDIALLKIDVEDPLPAAKIGDSDTLRIGNAVLAIGHPLGLDYSLTSGVVSSLNRSLAGGDSFERFVPFIQTDAAINPGNSGGPLLNAQGEVIGINSRIFAGRGGGFIGYSFAVPINLAMSVQTKLRGTGTIRRGMLGVTFNPEGITEADAKVWGLGDDVRGVLVNEVIEGTGAEAGGIEPGDVIIEYDGKAINDPNDFPRFIADTEPGTEVPIKLIRQGEEMVLPVTIGAIDDGGRLALLDEGGDDEESGTPYCMVLENLSAERKRAIGQTGGALLQGFDIDNCSDDVPQEMYKLKGGDIIIGVIIEGKLTVVENADALREVLRSLNTDTIGFRIIRGNSRRPFFITISLNT